MGNPYIEAMEKQAGPLLAKTRTMVSDLLERANLGGLNTEVRLRSPVYLKPPVAPAAAAPAAPAKKGPGIVGSTWNAGVRTVKGAASVPGDYTRALVGSNVNATIMRHGELAQKFSTESERHAFEEQLKGKSDEEKLLFTQNNLGPEAVKDVQKAMNTRAVTRTATTGVAAVAATKALSNQQDNQY